MQRRDKGTFSNDGGLGRFTMNIFDWKHLRWVLPWVVSTACATNYYVNDSSTSGDVYTAAVGASGNSGLTTNAPKDSLENIINSYALAAGDVVYIDTGTYNLTNTVTFGSGDSGSGGSYVTIQGSTNLASGGSIFDRQNTSANVVTFSSATYIRMNDMIVRGGQYGVSLSGSTFCEFNRCLSVSNSSYGLNIASASHNNQLMNCASAHNGEYSMYVHNSTNVVSQNCVFWGGLGIFVQSSALLTMSNSFVRAAGTGNTIYRKDAGGNVVGDYNAYYMESGAWFEREVSEFKPNLSDYQQSYTQDLHSSVFDPKFANVTNADFHPKSQYGHFAVGVGYTNDTETSGLIDMGNPSASFANEPTPNGSRRNVGRYGNTTEASKSTTNAWLQALTFNEGGTLSGTGSLYWAAANFTNNAKVRVQFSLDGGATWANIITNTPATNQTVQWNTPSTSSSARARWRVVSESNSAISDTNDTFFSVRNTNLFFYVNDTNTLGDVYCTAAGSTNNTGVSASSPKASLADLLSSYDLNGGDVVYIDTGNYVVTNATTISLDDTGSTTNYLTIYGSTNTSAGGTVFDCQNTSVDVLSLSKVSRVRLVDLIVQGGDDGVYVFDSNELIFEGVSSRNNNNKGFSFGSSSGFVQGFHLLRCLAVNNGDNSFYFAASTNVFLENIVSWGGRGLYFISSARGYVSNSIIRISGSSGYAYEWQSDGRSEGDYNVIFMTNSAQVLRDVSTTYPTLSSYQEQYNMEWHSSVFDPRFADVADYDFHLMSTTGRWDGTAFASDAVSSAAIDFGNPSSTHTNELSPNGSRINAGIYGNTSQASKSSTNASLLALTYNDGGTLNAGSDTVYWNSYNLLAGATVRIELSSDSGSSWVTVETNILASLGSYAWSNTNLASGLYARWRVVLESNTNVYDGTDNDHNFRSGPYIYYVNDASTDGDLYATAVGSDSNLGTGPGSPKASLQSVLDDHDVEPGDIIYIDTGIYNLTENQVIELEDSGATTNYVVIRGSTNVVDGGTLFDRQNTSGGAYGLYLNGASYIDMRDITVTNANVGMYISGASGIDLTRMSLQDNAVDGVQILNSSDIHFVNSKANANASAGFNVQSSTDITFEQGLLWKNATAGINIDGSSAVYISNSIVVARGALSHCFYAATTNGIVSDYNDVYAESNAVVGYVTALGRNLDTLSAWSAETGQDRRSLSIDPGFADPENGDFHLKTQTVEGRYEPGVGFVSDTETSALIDSGNTNAVYTNEPSFNGSRINIDLYGNTPEASKGRSTSWLLAASLSQGGWVRGTTILHWVANNFTNGSRVRVDFSPNGGSSWSTLSNNALASAESIAWNTTTTNNTPAGLWKVTSVTDTNIYSQTTNFFAIRNAALNIYVNDGSTNEDIYTRAAGTATNWLASTNQPLNSLASAFSVYDIEPGDTIYVDSGTYTNASAIEWGRLDSGSTSSPVRVLGSTNSCGRPSVMTFTNRTSGSYGMYLSYLRNIAISNMIFSRAHTGVRMENSSDASFGLVRSIGNASNGFEISLSSNLTFQRVVATTNGGFGFCGFTNTSTRLLQSVLWSNAAGSVHLEGGALHVSNTVLYASGSGNYIYDLSGASVYADYNDLFTTNNGYIARANGLLSKTLYTWQQRTTNDLHSLTHSPLFADPATGDFHPKSEMGRFSPSSCSVVTDAVGTTSLLIDTGDPASSFSSEPSPNGRRLNMGLYGNHTEASRSRTNGWFVALTLNDGGSVRGSNSLYWVAGGVATSHLVYIDFSLDGGTTWTNVATNLTASSGVYSNWNTSIYPSTPSGKWRITSQSNTNFYDATDNLFTINNGALSFYVNDTNTTGDVYTTAPGSSGNDGLSEDSPLLSVEDLLDRYEIQEGNVIYLDTGYYAITNAITFDVNTEGSVTNPIVLLGSTNIAAGGAIIDAQNQQLAIDIDATIGISLKYLTIKNAPIAIRADGASNCVMEWITVEGPTSLSGEAKGFQIESSGEIEMNHCAIRGVTNQHNDSSAVFIDDSTDVVWLNGVLWSNYIGFKLDDESALIVSNSVLGAMNEDFYVYVASADSSVSGDYNNYYLTNGAYLANMGVGLGAQLSSRSLYENVAQWTYATGNDQHSLSHDPFFVNTGTNDYHLLSEGGRYAVTNGAFVLDTNTSVIIDAGYPSAAFTNEPSPNGSRINIGRYGNTVEASKTPTNASFTVVSLNDGGRASGTQTLYWIAHGAATGHAVRLQFSSNSGQTWTNIITNLTAGTSSYSWNTINYSSTLFGAWRVVSEPNSTISDQSDRLFALRNTNFTFYVNDALTNGDVYTTAIGVSTNTGLSASSPKTDLDDVLTIYDIEPGDRIFIDTGTYVLSNGITILDVDAGISTNHVTIQGSTNEIFGGTVFSGYGLDIEASKGLTLKNLSFDLSGTLGDSGVDLAFSTNTLVEWVSVNGGGIGFFIEDSINTVFRHCVVRNASTNGVHNDSSFETVWENGVVWSNVNGIRNDSGEMSFSNSVVAVFDSDGYIYNGGPLNSDYNTILITNGALIGAITPFGQSNPDLYENLARWASDTEQDQHSLSQVPGFYDSAVGDFHLLSQMGRFVTTSGTFLVDSSSSLLIDAGAPDASYTNEPSPNGGRINIGLYGDTVQASKTPTNATLLAVSLNDGGLAIGTNVLLYWVARGAATSQAVRLQFSSDGGITWTNIATNLSAGTSSYSWNSTNYPSTLLGLWKVALESNTNVYDLNDQYFAVRNGALAFYVNDSSTNGDIYSTAIGVATNSGVLASSPKSSLQSIFDTYDVEPGDTIYIDTGSYTSSTEIVLTSLDAGNETNGTLLTIQGSTNYMAGGTTLHRSGATYGIELDEASAVKLRHLNIADASQGIRLYKSHDCILEWIHVSGGTKGFALDLSENASLVHCVARNASSLGLEVISSDMTFENSVLWSNGTYGVYLSSASARITNSVIAVFGQGSYAYFFSYLDTLLSDYNNIYLNGGAYVGVQAMPSTAPFSLIYQNVSRWARDTGNDQHSLSHDPGFVSPETGDFHLQSQGGRYATTNASFVVDAETSYLIDAGNPSSTFTNELSPNGRRINIGLYGHSVEASKTPTNARLIAVSLNDGGRAEGTVWPLNWIAAGAATGHTVKLEFSSDAGASWSTITTNLPARIGTIFWNTTTFSDTARGVWRVVSENNTNIYDESDSLFALHNDALSFYVNDSSTNGDVYCTAIGNSANTGVSPSSPLDSIPDILETYDLEPDDVIYVDTGNYLLTESIHINQFDAWDQATNVAALESGGVSITLQGSTNDAADGSQLVFFQQSAGIAVTQALGVAFRNIAIRHSPEGGGVGLRAYVSDYSSAEWVQCNDGEVGFDIDTTDYFTMEHCVAVNNTRQGLKTTESEEAIWRNGILWSNQFGAYQTGPLGGDGGSLLVENTVIGVFDSGDFGHFTVRGTLSSDYNNFYVSSNALVGGVAVNGSLGGGTNPFQTVYAWTQETGEDEHSLSENPQFADVGAGDYHPLSPAGRYVTGSGYITNSSEALSPLIDAGNPETSFTNEPSPNGSRVNIGLYGDSAQASKTPTNGALTTITLNGGGNAQDTITLNWSASGSSTGHLVYVDFSSNGGATWTNIATNVQASVGTVEWDSAPYGRAAAGLWRVVSQTDSNIFDITDSYFALRNGGSIPYYVNDSLSACDVFSTAAGHDDNDGYLPSTPKASLQNLVDSIDLEPGDIVYVDSGTYQLSVETLIGVFDSGESTNRVVFQGATNTCEETMIDRQTGSGNAIHLFQTLGIEIRDFTIQNADVGITIEEADDCRFVGVRSENNSSSGFTVQESSGAEFEHCIASFNDEVGISSIGGDDGSASLTWQSGVIWGQSSAVFIGENGSATISNSALHAAGSDGRIYYFEDGALEVVADYNNIVRDSGSLVAEQEQIIAGNDFYGKLIDWQRDYGQDLHSLSHDPLFVDEDNGDFHLQSAEGRFVDDGTMTNDSAGVFSPMIDTGDPSSAFTNEVDPNGDRINIGRYGNTAYASLSQTNPWVLAITLNDGGRIGGTNTIYWAAGGMATDATVRLEYADDGIDFAPFASNILASEEAYIWDVSSYSATIRAKWKIVSETYAGVEDEVDNAFVVKNGILNIYVNDASTNGDIYACGIGSATNNGLTACLPLNEPAVALERYPLSAGDTIYIDTGTYAITNATGMQVGLVGDVVQSGVSGLPIRVQGSTNTLAGGSVIIGGGSEGIGLLINDTEYIEVDHLKFRGTQVGLSVQNSENISISHVECYSNTNHGFQLQNANNCSFDYCAAWNNRGKGISSDGGLTAANWNHGVCWSNLDGSVSVGLGSFGISNSILHAYSNAYVYSAGLGTLNSDYNFVVTTNSGRLARDTQLSVDYSTMAAWQRARDVDTHSVRMDPLFANSSTGDFHLKSQAGRYSSGTMVTDAVTSWAIDAGAIGAAYSNEPSPNGSRLNVGLFGNTFQESRTVTNASSASLLVVSLNDGGLVTGTRTLYWLSRGMSTSDQVYVEFSENGGAAWTVIATNQSAVQSGITWDPSTFDSTPIGIWRVTSQSNPSIKATNAVPFTLRLGPISYYVNNTSTVGDVYSTAVGSSTNDGLTPSTPKNSIMGIVTNYDLEGGNTNYGGDIIYVDTGNYALTNTILILNDDSGNDLDPLHIVGSTNRSAGGTILNGENVTDAVSIYNAQYIAFSDFTIQNADVGINMEAFSASCTFSNMLIRSNRLSGIRLSENSDCAFRHVVVARNSGPGIESSTGYGNVFENCIVWSNSGSAVALSVSSMTISNSVLSASGSNYCYQVNLSDLTADYNDLVVSDEANYAIMGGTIYEGLPQWIAASTQDVHSLSVDPLFANDATYDFHVRSAAGRFDPSTSLFVTTDTNFSYLIDTGSTNALYSSEPAPNGSRINIGRYGNTVEASKSRTNEWLLAITASSGGRLSDLFHLVWAWGGMAGTNEVTLDYSYDDGSTWINIASNIAVAQGQYLWDSLNTPETVSPIARWRIVKESNTNVYDVTDSSFGLNGPFTFYVNDTTTSGDIYTTTVGSDLNLGVNSNGPKATLQAILDLWDLEGEDSVLVDSGVYSISSNTLMTLESSDQGNASYPVTILGSTNSSARSIFSWSHADFGADLLTLNASYITLSDFVFAGGGFNGGGTNLSIQNLIFTNGSFVLFGANSDYDNVVTRQGSVSIGGNGHVGSDIKIFGGQYSASGADIELLNSIVSMSNDVAVSISGTNLTIESCTIISSNTAVRQTGADSSCTLENNIIIANGAAGEAFCIHLQGGSLVSDYNDLVARNGAWIGNYNGNWEKLFYWQRASGKDTYSLSDDPEFIGESTNDFHVKSVIGRYTASGFVADSVHSPAIDAGKSSSSFANESSPNGSRINLGAYGNTDEASRSKTNEWLLAVTMNDSGVLKGTNTIRWLSGNLNPTNKLSLYYSADGGTTWTNFASGISAISNSYTWDTTQVTSSLTALWRILLESNTNVQDQVDQNFAVRNTPLNFYVNDSSTNNDVYCTAVGSAANSGLTPALPQSTIQNILSSYDLEGADTVYVDTGQYSLTSDVTVIWSRSGDASYGNVQILGSTNVDAGGTELIRGGTGSDSDGFHINASYVTVRGFEIRDAYRGAFLVSNSFVRLERLFSHDNLYGASLNGAVSPTIINSIFWNNSTSGVDVVSCRTALVENCTFYENEPYSVKYESSVDGTIQNNIFSATGTNHLAALNGSADNVFIDYNIYYFEEPTAFFGEYYDLLSWQLDYNHDFRSAVTNPMLADVDAGDFHEKSTAGRYVDGFGWTNDTVDSWAIDKGDPDSDYDTEPEVNGDRINIGAYGNTEYASIGSTDVVVYARTLNDGLAISETNSTVPLIWTSINVPPAATYSVQYSGDGGDTWSTIESNVSAYQEYILWTPSPYYNTYKGQWRIVGEGAYTNYVDQNDQPYNLFYGDFEISSEIRTTNRVSIVWRGAWDESYQVQYTTNILATSGLVWVNAPTGSAVNQRANFISTNGGDFTYEDATSTGIPYRLYRVLWEQY